MKSKLIHFIAISIALLVFPNINFGRGLFPLIITPPANQTVCAGSSASFTVTAAGLGLTYQWRKGAVNLVNGGNISGANSATLTISPAGLADAALDYNVIVTALLQPNDTSINVSLTVNPLPVVSTGPSDTICYGDTISIGGPTIAGDKYKWTPNSGLSSYTISNPKASPADTTTYTLTVTDTITGCSNSGTLLIIVKPVPEAFIINGDTANFCVGEPLILTASNGATFLWSNGDTTQSITAMNGGTYFVGVTYANGCTDYSGPTKVTVNPLPIADAGPDKSICKGDSVIIGTPGINKVTYNWAPATGLNYDTVPQPEASPTITTTYILTVTDTVKGCKNTDTVKVNVLPPPIANAGPDKTICKKDSASIGTPALPGNTYSWSPVTGLSSSTKAQPDASPSVTTTYTLTVSNGICTSTDTVEVTVNPLPVANAGPDKAICKGDSVVIGTSGVNGDSYSWSPSTGLDYDTVPQPEASPTITTTYILTITDTAMGCSNTDTVTVTVNPLPVANAGLDKTICKGDSVTIGTPGILGDTYSWSPVTGLSSSTIAQPNASPAISTIYTLTVNNGGCTNTDTVKVTVNPLPLALAGPDKTICKGDSTIIGTPAILGNTYSWSPITGLSSSTIAMPNASPSVTTIYTLTVSNGICTNTDTVKVNVAPDLANAGPNKSVCKGDSTIIGTPGVLGNIYIWLPITGLSSPIVAQPNASPAVTTTYTLTVTNGICTNTDTVTVTVNPLPIVNAGPDKTICRGDSTNIGTAAILGNTYSWLPVAGLSTSTIAQPNASPAITTIYTLTVSNGGCTNTDTVKVTVNPLPVANAGPDKAICKEDSTSIGTAAILGSTYSWLPVAGLSSSTIAQPNASPAVTTIYTLTVNNGTCTNTDTIKVTVNPLPVANAGPDKAICKGDSTIIGTPAILGNTYSWLPITGLSSSTVAQPNASPAISTIYTLTVSNGGCTNTDTIKVTINPLPVANAGVDKTVCKGDSANIGTPAIFGSTYSWSPIAGLSSSTMAQPNASPSVTTIYILTVSNGICTNTDTVKVTVTPFLADAGPDKSICKGDSTSIGTAAVAGDTYVWLPVTGLSSATVAQPNASPAVTTVYTLTVTNGICTNTDTVRVTVSPAPVANAGQDKSICKGDSTSIGTIAIAGNTYDWSPAAGLSSSTIAQPNASPASTTLYTVTVTNGVCSKMDTVLVSVHEVPAAITGNGQTLCDGGSVVLGGPAVTGDTYLWTPSTGLSSSTVAQPTATINGTILYTLLETDTATGCSMTNQVTITIEPNEFYTGISPNGDGINDWWDIPMLDCYPDNTVVILNRWGSQVWMANNYNNTTVRWAGQNMNGTDLPADTYYYTITYNNTRKEGWIFIKR